MMNKKGAEIALNVIIIAAIALIVLIVVVFIFTGRIGKFGGGLDALEDCAGQGGVCKTGTCPTGTTPIGKCGTTQVCCVNT